MSVRRATFPDLLEQFDRLARQASILRPEKTRIAAFDADGTLWQPDIADLLWDHLLREKALQPRAAAPLARAIRDCGQEPARDPYVDYGRLRQLHAGGMCPEEVLIRAMLEGLVGLTEEELYLHSATAISGSPALAGLADSPSARMIVNLRQQGFRVIVVSASPHWSVEVAVRPLGIEPGDIIAGRVAVVQGTLTDGAIDPIPYGQGKIQTILRRHGTVPCIAVGNGLGDLAMLEATSHLRLLVNPTEELLKACAQGGPVAWSMGSEKTARTAPSTGKKALRARARG